MAGGSAESGTVAPLPNVEELEVSFEGFEVDRLKREIDHACPSPGPEPHAKDGPLRLVLLLSKKARLSERAELPQ